MDELIIVESVLRSAVAIILVFVVSIVIHEFGHYIVAKKCGVAVPAFAIGFGPKLIRWYRRGTEFSVRLFPIGGMVQLAGELPQDTLFRKGERLAVEFDDEGRIQAVGDPSDLPRGQIATLEDLDLMDRLQMTLAMDDGVRTYPVRPHARLMTSTRNSMPIVERHEQVLGKPLWQRAAMILAGPFMNFLLAGVLFTLLNLHTGIPVNSPVLGQIVPNTPAAQAGLMQGDRVEKVDGQTIQNWAQLVKAIQSDNPPKPLTVVVDRSGRTETLVVRPHLVTVQGQKVPQLGVNAPVTHDPVQAFTSGFASVYYGSVNTVQLYGQVISHHQFQDLSGPVGIADVISQQAQSGVWQVVFITALLSLNLGLFNLFPIPALDGGRLLFMVVEMVRGKGVDPRKEGLVHFVGFALLMLFAVVITYRDVTRLF
ncbi:RIP metalloprotease RseP [Alicyclobacillus cycloheptanicus]|uniref:Zinc metalloprotease n=1 Tax=Alicyclobacillus cycloheptanicus TaxID=1457 RepID=A0ABT9XJP2_9BACL|nr:RIP metalloprotease RseP [Alicyclobacillus cycloheptanicus]MDQ0190529.1 regulator of sigma E protease [Alicyclobacillus cycloheptanicus]WDM01372.1 RIP metalloprotease RseP [Alicyclobacillus cycloheptanicus]